MNVLYQNVSFIMFQEESFGVKSFNRIIFIKEITLAFLEIFKHFKILYLGHVFWCIPLTLEKAGGSLCV